MIESQISEKSEQRHSDVVEWLFAWISTSLKALVDLCKREILTILEETMKQESSL